MVLPGRGKVHTESSMKRPRAGRGMLVTEYSSRGPVEIPVWGPKWKKALWAKFGAGSGECGQRGDLAEKWAGTAGFRLGPS